MAWLKRTSRTLAKWRRLPQRTYDLRSTNVRASSERYLLYFLLPTWLIPGALDWWCHRRTKIEDTSGSRESGIHALMMTEVGVPVMLGLILEVNAPVLAMMVGNVAVHEATAFWDVATAIRGGRKVTPNEQHVHSLLEVLPFMAASFMVCLHWDEALAMLGVGRRRADWRLRWKRPRLRGSYLATIGAAIAAGLGLPYAEEFLRCRRAERARVAAAGRLLPPEPPQREVEAAVMSPGA